MGSYQYKVRQTVAGQNVENNIVITGPDALPATAEFIGGHIAAAWQTALRPVFSTDVILDSILMREVGAAPGTPFVEVATSFTPNAGINVEQGLPTTVSMTLALSSNEGPPWRGHLALCGFTVEAIDSDREFSAGAVTAGISFIDDILSGISGDGWDAGLGILSQGTPTVPAGTVARVNSWVARSVPGSRYSRKKGIGS